MRNGVFPRHSTVRRRWRSQVAFSLWILIGFGGAIHFINIIMQLAKQNNLPLRLSTFGFEKFAPKRLLRPYVWQCGVRWHRPHTICSITLLSNKLHQRQTAIAVSHLPQSNRMAKVALLPSDISMAELAPISPSHWSSSRIYGNRLHQRSWYSYLRAYFVPEINVNRKSISSSI